MSNKSINTPTNGQVSRKRKSRADIKDRVLSTDPTRDYQQSNRTHFWGETLVQNMPPWRIWTGRMMLDSDPLVTFGLNVRNAALMPAEIEVKCKNQLYKNWIEEQWNFIWNHYRTKITSAKEFGFSALQVNWKMKDGLMVVKSIKDFAPEDSRCLQVDNRTVGWAVKNEKVYFPQALWTTFGSKYGNAYGRGCLRRMYPAWYEKWMEHGAQRLRQLRMIKDAYIGDIFWYPMNMIVELPDGTKMPFKDLMRELGENRLSGGALTLPRVYDDNGKPLTDYTPPQDIGGGSQIFEWVDSCDLKMLQGCDVPMEVIQAAETGSGYSGRSIPFLAMLSVCNNEFSEILQALDECVFRVGAWLNWGGDIDYEIIPKNLVETFSDDTQGSPMGGGAVGGQPSSAVPVQVVPNQPPAQQQQFSEDEIDHQLVKQAKQHFGETKNIREAGYLMHDKSMLDLSGRHLVNDYKRNEQNQHVLKKSGRDYRAGQRSTDHRDLYDRNTDRSLVRQGGTDGMYEFMRRTGAIRIHATDSDLNAHIHGKHNSDQINHLVKHARKNKLHLNIDLDGEKQTHSRLFKTPNVEHVHKWIESTKSNSQFRETQVVDAYDYKPTRVHSGYGLGEAKQLLENTGKLRGIHHEGSNKTYLWDATKAHHAEIAKRLKIRSYKELNYDKDDKLAHKKMDNHWNQYHAPKEELVGAYAEEGDSFAKIHKTGMGWIHPDGSMTHVTERFGHEDAIANHYDKIGAKKIPSLEEAVEDGHVHVTSTPHELSATGLSHQLHRHRKTLEGLAGSKRKLVTYKHTPGEGFNNVMGGTQHSEEPKYSCAMLMLPPEVAMEVLALAKKIDGDDLYATDHGNKSGGGVELEPHITIKYGIHTNSPEEVKKALFPSRGLPVWPGPIAIDLGNVSYFEGKEYDVVKLDVNSKGLKDLNSLISRKLEVTDTFPDYKPHCTIAYVKKGTGAKWAEELNKHAIKNRVVAFDHFTFSDAERNHYEIRLGGEVQFTEDRTAVEIQKVIKTLPPLMPGYGYCNWDSSTGRLHIVSGDSDTNEEVKVWIDALKKVKGVKEVTCEAEHTPEDMKGKAKISSRKVEGGIPSNGDSFQYGERLTAEEATELTGKIKDGQSESKNKGIKSHRIPLKGEHLKTKIPTNLFHPDYVQFLRESTQPHRVETYTKNKIDTPIHAVRNRKGKWSVHDGGHRLLAAIDRKDSHIPAIVSAEDHKHIESQHAEESDEKLKEFLSKGAGAKLQEHLARINALKTYKLENLSELHSAIQAEIQALRPLLTAELVASNWKSTLEGIVEVVRALPKEVLNKLPPSTTNEGVTAESLLEHVGSTLGSPTVKGALVRYPILEDAISTLRHATGLSGSDYRDTAAKVHAGAFSVTTDLSDKVTEQVKEVFTTALEEGHSRDRFIDTVVEKLGEGTFKESHLENIFRTNAMSALSNGKLKALQLPMVADAFPYVYYSATHDARVRPQHKELESLGLNGTNIYRADDPTFLKFRPPWSWQCRCTWFPQTVEQAARKGVKEATDWLERAKAKATLEGGDWSQYLLDVAPMTPEYVTPPDFEPDPEFVKPS